MFLRRVLTSAKMYLHRKTGRYIAKQEGHFALNHLPDATYAFAPYNKPVMSNKEAAETLKATSGWILAKGRMWDLKAVSLGAGMSRIELTERK